MKITQLELNYWCQIYISYLSVLYTAHSIGIYPVSKYFMSYIYSQFFTMQLLQILLFGRYIQ